MMIHQSTADPAQPLGKWGVNAKEHGTHLACMLVASTGRRTALLCCKSWSVLWSHGTGSPARAHRRGGSPREKGSKAPVEAGRWAVAPSKCHMCACKGARGLGTRLHQPRQARTVLVQAGQARGQGGHSAEDAACRQCNSVDTHGGCGWTCVWGCRRLRGSPQAPAGVQGKQPKKKKEPVQRKKCSEAPRR
jgi:hypothetical protein